MEETQLPEVQGIERFRISQIMFNERDYFQVKFLDDFENFVKFVKEHNFNRLSPIMDLGRPNDRFGMERYKECVTNVSYVFITPNILAIHVATDGSQNQEKTGDVKDQAIASA